MHSLRPEPVQLGLWFLVWAFLLVVFAGPTVAFWFLSIPVGLIVSGSILLLFAIGAVWLRLFHQSHQYAYDDDELSVRYGVVWKQHALIPLSRITNLRIIAGPFERLAGVSKLAVHTAGHSGQMQAEATLKGLPDAEGVRAALMQRVRQTKGDGTGADGPERPAPSASEPGDAAVVELKAIRRLLEKQA